MAARTARRMVAARALWNAMSGSRHAGSPGVGERISALPRLLGATLSGRYAGMTRGRLGLMALALLYLVSPIDAMPELLFTVFGLGDDALVAAWLAGTVLAETEEYLRWESAEVSRRRRSRVVPGEIITPRR